MGAIDNNDIASIKLLFRMKEVHIDILSYLGY